MYSCHGNEFISPLETALIDQENLLKLHEGDEQSDGDDEKLKTLDENMNNGNINTSNSYGSYFPVNWIPNFLYSPTFMNRNNDVFESEGTKLAESNNDEVYSSSTTSFRSDAENEAVSLEVKHVNSNESNPLLEADDIIARMDRLSETVSHVIASEHKKKKKSKTIKVNDRILKRIYGNAKGSDLTMEHSLPGTRLLILEELGTASSWVILLLPYVAFLLGLILDSGSLWSYTSNPLEISRICTSSNYTNVPLQSLPDYPCWYNYELQKGEGLLSFVEENLHSDDSAFELLMKRGVRIKFLRLVACTQK